MPDHEWVEVAFSYASWVECTCGYKPYTQDQMREHDRHTARTSTEGENT